MTTSIQRLDLDLTGKNINNLITDEPHELSSRPTRSIAPRLGPFFAESLVLRDSSGISLSRGKDYQIVELHQEATLRYGKEISSVILVINSKVSSQVTITYQALGGHYSNDDTAIANLYQSVINDNRPVDWSNIFNKPTEFNPTIHRHLLDDVYGFEPVVDYLERIKRAITLGQTSIVLEIVNSLLSNFSDSEFPLILPSKKLVQYDALLYFLSRKKLLSNAWVDKKDSVWVKGSSSYIQVDTSHYPVGVTLYWELYKPGGNIALFTCTKGSFKSNGGIVDISVYAPSDPTLTDDPIYVGIKDNPKAKDFIAVTYTLDVQDYASTNSGYGVMLYNNQDYAYNDNFVSAFAEDDELRLWYQLSNG